MVEFIKDEKYDDETSEQFVANFKSYTLVITENINNGLTFLEVHGKQGFIDGFNFIEKKYAIEFAEYVVAHLE